MSTPPRKAVTQKFLDDLYGRLARRYDRLNAVQSFGLDGIVRREAARHLAGGEVLDVGAGSGDLAAACLAAGARRVVCLDRSPEMFAVARAKLRREEKASRAAFVLGEAGRLPFRDGVFDNVGTAFVLRNIPDVEGALGEMKRVLRPGGGAAVVDVLAPPGGLVGAIYRLYLKTFVPLWGRLIVDDRPAYRYLSSSIRRCFTGEELARRLAAAGFAEVGDRPKFGGIAHVIKARHP